MKRVAIFPGSFDPFTKGHYDIVKRGALLFDELVIGVGHNINKKRYLPVDDMCEKIASCFVDMPNIRVQKYNNLTADFAKEIGAKYLLRGLRNTTDYEYENSIAQANRYINADLETVFLITSPKVAYISSSFVREIHRFGHEVSEFVPYPL